MDDTEASRMSIVNEESAVKFNSQIPKGMCTRDRDVEICVIKCYYIQV